MINKVMSELMNEAFNYGFIVIIDNRFTPYTPAAVNPNNKTIVINSNWHKPNQIPFQLAHEMGHLLNNDGESSCLYFSPTKNGIEGAANKTAIKLLLPFYLEDNDFDQISSSKFMELLGMNQYLEDIVQSEILNYYKTIN